MPGSSGCSAELECIGLLLALMMVKRQGAHLHVKSCCGSVLAQHWELLGKWPLLLESRRSWDNSCGQGPWEVIWSMAIATHLRVCSLKIVLLLNINLWSS